MQFNKYTYIHTYIHTYILVERVGSVATNPDNLGSNKEAGGGAQGAQGSSKICTSRESVSPLSRLNRGFVTSTIDPPLGGSMRVAKNDSDDRAGLRGYVQFNTYTYIHTYTHTYIHTDCAVMCNLINIHTYIHTYTPLSRLIRGFRNKYH